MSDSVPALAAVLTHTALRRLAGPRSFERGEGYAADGAVGALAEDDAAGVVAARVRGTDTYRVRLWAEGATLAFSCTCPVGADGACCKHCVAVGLVWLERRDGAAEEGSRGSAVTMAYVRAHLAGQPKEALVELLVAQAMEDDRLRRRLCLEVASTAARVGDRPGVAGLRTLIDEAARVDGYLDYDQTYDYAAGVDNVIDALETLLDKGHTASAVELVEHAIDTVEASMGAVDDSDGHVGGLLARLAELHLAACEQADLDPVELAGRLFARELNGNTDTFFGALATYAEVLGPQGLAAYCKLAEAEWERVTPLTAGERYTFDHRRLRITQMMEALAGLAGDVDAMVAVKRRDLSHPYAYQQIAEAYREAGRYNEALDWAEQGMAAFPEPRADARLRAFLAEEYHRRRRHDEAVALLWQAFSQAPRLEPYQELRAHAERAGQWPAWRERALAVLRERALAVLREQVAAARRTSAPGGWGWAAADHSELVRVFLWEGDIEAAWAEAQAGGCADALWLDLAAKRADTHPEASLPIYQRAVDQALTVTGNDAYQQAVDLLGKVRDLLRRMGREAEFAPYVASVRTTHRRKRNLMKLLDATGW